MNRKHVSDSGRPRLFKLLLAIEAGVLVGLVVSAVLLLTGCECVTAPCGDPPLEPAETDTAIPQNPTQSSTPSSTPSPTYDAPTPTRVVGTLKPNATPLGNPVSNQTLPVQMRVTAVQ